MTGMTFDKERVSFNLARIKKGGKNFEIDVDFDQAIAFKEGKIEDIKSVLKVEQIFNDVAKGLQASDTEMQQLFNTSDSLEVAKIIIEKGEIQLTQEYREKLREEKKKQIVNLIHRNGVDPRTHAPHPPQRIENALEEAKIRIGEFESAEKQVKEILKKIKVILPIRFETKEIALRIPADYAAKSYSIVESFGTILKNEWQKDGSWVAVVEIPGGLEQDLYDKVNALCHGDVETKVVEIK